MIVLLAGALGSGFLAAIALCHLGAWVAAIGASLAASSATIVIGCLMAWRGWRHDQRRRELDAQTGLMVAALRDVAEQGEPTSPAPRTVQRRLGT